MQEIKAKSADVRQHFSDGIQEFGEVILDDIENFLFVHAVVFMNDDVAESHDVAPGDFRVIRQIEVLGFVVESFYVFADKDELHAYSTQTKHAGFIQKEIIGLLYAGGLGLNEADGSLHFLQDVLFPFLAKHRGDLG